MNDRIADLEKRLRDTEESLVSTLDLLSDEQDRNARLTLVILKLRERWWPFVHGAVMASEAAKNLFQESGDAVQPNLGGPARANKIVSDFKIQQQIKALEGFFLNFPEEKSGLWEAWEIIEAAQIKIEQLRKGGE